MLEAVLKDAFLLKSLVQSFKELVKDLNINASPQGLHIIAMDESRVALISLHLNYEGFLRYRCDKTSSFGIPVKNLHKILQLADPCDDTVTLKNEQQEFSHLEIIFENIKRDKYKEFKLNTVYMEDDYDRKVPDVKTLSEINVCSEYFGKLCRELF